MAIYIEDYVPVVKYNGLNTAKNVDFSAATTVALPAGTTIGSGGTLTAPIIAGGLTASGSATNDFSGSTGAFKTSTGAVTIGSGAVSITGAVTFAANQGIVMTAGTGAMDFSLGTGVFKTTTGASTFGGSSNSFTNTISGTSTTMTGSDTLKSGTAVPATAGAVAAGAPLILNSNGITIEATTDAPTHTRPAGSLCININGNSSSTRLYVSAGAGSWVAITTAS